MCSIQYRRIRGLTKLIYSAETDLLLSKAPCVSMSKTATSFPAGVFIKNTSDQTRILLEEKATFIASLEIVL